MQTIANIAIAAETENNNGADAFKDDPVETMSNDVDIVQYCTDAVSSG